ncbi:MAG: M48 family metallopeptidase [Thermoleophilia bacterium]
MDELPTDWRGLGARGPLQELGTAWARGLSTAVLAVPSVVPPAAEPGGARVPPVYTVRVSPRARRASLRMSADRGLEVVVPRGFHVDRVPALVAEKAAWIERVARRFAAERAAAEEVASAVRWVDGLPDRIELAAVGEVWAVEYRATASTRVRVSGQVGANPAGGPGGAGPAGEAFTGPDGTELSGGALRALDVTEPPSGDPTVLGGRLLVSGAVGHPEACRAALRRWLSRKARIHLVALLAGVGQEEGLSYSTVTVRGQRTRWGSCSRRGAISLNRHLLFLPPRLVRYVLLHELCHTVRPDHSPRFWEEVRRREPQAERLRKELRVAGRCVPRWARGLGTDSN